MASQFVTAAVLNPRIRQRAIRLRLTRTYLSRDYARECLFHDSEGTFIHVQFPKPYVEKYSSLFKEGQLYDIENFVVQSSRMKFRTCDHKYMIKANHETSVQRSMLNDSDEIDFPKQMFNLKDFASLKMPGGVDESQLFDLIGRVVTITQSKIIQVNGNPSRLIDFVIEDARESRLTVTMWDEHVDCVLPYYNVDLEDPLIVIIQLCRARVDQYGEVRISSSYSATKLLFNYECPEILNFKESLPRFFSPIRSISSRSRLSGSGTMNGETLENITITPLKEIYDKKEAGEFWVLGEIVGIEGGGQWCFIACKGKSCGKKLQPKKGTLYCKACDKHSQDGVTKYKLEIAIAEVNEDDDATLLLWDRDCFQMLGVTASELQAKHAMNGGMPNEIQTLVGMTMLFNIVVRKDQFKNGGSIPFSVDGVLTDEAVVARVRKNGVDGEVVRKLSDEPEFMENSQEGTGSIDLTSAASPDLILIDDNTPEKQILKRTEMDGLSSSKALKKPKIEPNQ